MLYADRVCTCSVVCLFEVAFAYAFFSFLRGLLSCAWLSAACLCAQLVLARVYVCCRAVRNVRAV